MPQARDDEYAELKEFLSFFADRFLNAGALPPNKRPVAVLRSLEDKSAKVALNGLRQAINDCVEMSFEFDHQQVANLDEQLQDLRIVTLSELRRRYSKRYSAIVRRGQIRNDTEYHLIRNALCDKSAKTPTEREALEILIADYERT